jgi:signal transduction histidine kinase
MMISMILRGQPPADEVKTRIADVNRVVTETVEGLRVLIKQLQSKYENDLSLPEAVQQELSRHNRLGIVATTLNVEGIPKKLDNKTSLFLFRMSQESLHNIVTHSRAQGWRRRQQANIDANISEFSAKKHQETPELSAIITQ